MATPQYLTTSPPKRAAPHRSVSPTTAFPQVPLAITATAPVAKTIGSLRGPISSPRSNRTLTTVASTPSISGRQEQSMRALSRGMSGSGRAPLTSATLDAYSQIPVNPVGVPLLRASMKAPAAPINPLRIPLSPSPSQAALAATQVPAPQVPVPPGYQLAPPRSASESSRNNIPKRASQSPSRVNMYAQPTVENFDMETERHKDKELTGQHAVMSWLGWSPKLESPCYKALHEHFPGALPASMLHARMSGALEDYGLTPENTLLGCSTCPDEINSEPGGLVSLLEEDYGMLFPMGGISGIPFAGKTGFIAFSHHVPDDGHVLVLFGPHVGISEDGEIGQVHRCGQSSKSTACGAVIGAYKSCIGQKATDAEFDPTDMQMDWIKQHIQPFADKISQEEEPMAALAHKSYELVEEEIKKVVNTKFGTGNLVLMGGIMINMPKQHSMHFLPRFFEVRREGAGSINLMSAFECRASDPCIRKFVGDSNEELALKAKILGSVKWFKDTATHDRMRAARSLVQMSYSQQETIMNQGDAGNTAFMLLSGEVSVEIDGKMVNRLTGFLRLDDDDVAQQVDYLQRVQEMPDVACFGESRLLTGERRNATIRVISKFAVVDMMTLTEFVRLSKDIKDKDDEVVDGSIISFNFQTEKQKDASSVQSISLFAHMGWSPSFEAESFRVLHEYFPGALPSHAMHARILEALSNSRFGLTPANTIFGTSVCPDEINTMKNCLPKLQKAYWGKAFPLGGISGTPFAGKTGFKAFSHHVPDNGNVVILFGPHVGVSASGEVGKVHRDGQACESTSCGAVVGAYKACLDPNYSDDDFDKSDMQMGWIKSVVGPKVKDIEAFKNPLAMLSHFAYEMVKAKLRSIVNNEFSSGYLVLIGGIQINMPEPYCEHFLPCMFEICKRGEHGHIDLKAIFDTPH